jgi:anion-transporting  ArsA/GET3 family ATPase
MTVEELIERRLIFIAGKGGVGKSTMTAALGLTAAKRGRRVCLVETDGQEQMASLFRTEPVGYEGRTLAPNIRGLSITTEGALKEFATTRMPLHQISQHLIDNRLMRYFLDATPGLKELLALGKIAHMVAEEDDDVVIVDLPATGHGLAMLSVPDVVIGAVHAGPLLNYAEETRDLINDPEVSAVCFVTLAEELAASETIELYDAIMRDMDIAIGPVIANGVHLPLIEEKNKGRFESLARRWKKGKDTASLVEGAELEMSRAALNRAYVERLEEGLGKPPLVVPFLFTGAVDWNALVRISDELMSGTTP